MSDPDLDAENVLREDRWVVLTPREHISTWRGHPWGAQWIPLGTFRDREKALAKARKAALEYGTATLKEISTNAIKFTRKSTR